MDKKYIESIGQAYQQVQEKLKGGQHKLDHDKDGDIDGNDFAAMRAKKKKMDETKIPDDCVACPKCEGKGCNHCDDKGYHKKDEMDEASCGSGKKVRKEDEEVIMNPKKKKEKGDVKTDPTLGESEQLDELSPELLKRYRKKAKTDIQKRAAKADIKDRKVQQIRTDLGDNDGSRPNSRYYHSDSPSMRAKNAVRQAQRKLAKAKMREDTTQWPIYQRIMEKNAVNQHAVPPEKMAPTDVEGDHISKAAAEWIKDHQGNEKPEDYVDINKVVGKNKMDALRTVPSAAKDEVNKKAKGAEAQPKANKEA